MRLRNGIIAILCVAAVATAHAQWLNYPAAGIPRTKDGKPDLAAPLPRANGKPDSRECGPPTGQGARRWTACFLASPISRCPAMIQLLFKAS